MLSRRCGVCGAPASPGPEFRLCASACSCRLLVGGVGTRTRVLLRGVPHAPAPSSVNALRVRADHFEALERMHEERFEPARGARSNDD